MFDRFSVGLSAWSTTQTSIGAFADSNLSPSRSWIAVITEGYWMFCKWVPRCLPREKELIEGRSSTGAAASDNTALRPLSHWMGRAAMKRGVETAALNNMSESAAKMKLFFAHTFAQNCCRGYTKSDRSGG
jgi:hypothetical protein